MDSIKKIEISTKSCLACSAYWTCHREEKRAGKGCVNFLSNKDKALLTKGEEGSNEKGLSPSLQKKSNEKLDTNFNPEVTNSKEKSKKHSKQKKEVLFDLNGDLENSDEDYSNYLLDDTLRLSLPEDDFPLAKNLHEFVFSRRFLNLGATGLFARQLGIGLNLFTEYCPKCSDLNYVANNFEVLDSIETILTRVTLFEHGVCPKCKTEKREFVKTHESWYNTELAALCGQRSGKSLMAAIFAAYTLHRFLKLPCVADAYSVAKPTIFLGTFVALDKSQIQESTWGYLVNIIKASPWFTSYCDMLKFYGRKYGRKLVDIDKVETIEFFHKNLKLNMAAPRPSALRGRTGFIGVIDEIGFLKAKDTEGRVITADEVYAALNNRMATLNTAFETLNSRHRDLPTPLFVNISSPSHATDKICTLVKNITKQKEEPENKTRQLRRYAVVYPTWDINPMFSRKSAFIQSKFKDNANEAERDFGARPPLSENPFFDNPSLLQDNFHKHLKNLITIDYTIGDRGSPYTINIHAEYDNKLPRVLALDLGLKNNSTAISIGYFDEQTNKVITEGLCEIIPTRESEVNFLALKDQVIKPLIERLNIKLVTADRWQSVSLLQELKQLSGIEVLTYSLKYEDFYVYKQNMLSSQMIFPALEDTKQFSGMNLLLSCPEDSYPHIYYNLPITHFFFQCMTVVDEINKTVQKGEKTTDDLFRANVLMAHILNNPQYREKLKNNSPVLNQGGPVAYVQSVRGTSNQAVGTPKYTGTSVVVM
jgi:hypothetical protein